MLLVRLQPQMEPEPEPEPQPEPEVAPPAISPPRVLPPLETAELARFSLPSPDKHLTGLWNHPLEKADPDAVYPQFNGGWACDGCGQLQSAEMYHCQTTGNYDLCATCVRKKGYLADLDQDPIDEEELPRLASRGLAKSVSLGTDFRQHSHGSSSPEPELPTQSGAADGGASPVKAELSRQEYWSIYRQHTSDEVRAVAEATAQASEDADADVSDEQLSMEQKLTRLYRSIDSDFSNSVDAKELWEGLARIGLGLSHDHVQKLVRSADGDGDGTLDLAEFLAAFTASFLVKW